MNNRDLVGAIATNLAKVQDAYLGMSHPEESAPVTRLMVVVVPVAVPPDILLPPPKLAPGVGSLVVPPPSFVMPIVLSVLCTGNRKRLMSGERNHALTQL